MTKFVIAGRSDCPYYAKSELLADKLSTNLESFSIHKELVKSDAWESWLDQQCKKHGFRWSNSPVIWRELTERGGKGSLLGGYNEFCEYAKLYYDQEYEMTSALAKDVAEENKLVRIKEENERRQKREQMKPLNIAFTNPTSALAYQLLPAIVKRGAVFEDERVKDGIILKSVGECSDSVSGMLMEMTDLSEGLLSSVEMYSNVDEVTKSADLLLILDDNDKFDNETRVEWINRNREKYVNYGKTLAGFKGRIFVSGQFATIGAYLIMQSAGDMASEQVLTTAAVAENAGRGCISRKLGLNASKIHNVLYYGSTLDATRTALFSTGETTVQGIESSIYGPSSFHRSLDEVLFDNEWKIKEFDAERRGNKSRPLAQCAALVKVFKEWFSSCPTGLIISCGVRPEPTSTLSSSYICLPGTFSKDGKFTALKIALSEVEKVALVEVDRINKRAEQICAMSETEQFEFATEERNENDKCGTASVPLGTGTTDAIIEEEEEEQA